MSKLAKYKGSLGRAKSKALSIFKGAKGSDGIGKTGHVMVQVGTHAVLALASKNITTLGPVPIRPDVAGLMAGGAAMMLGKGKLRKLGADVARGAVDALITRFVATERVSFIEGVDVPLRAHGAQASASE